MAIVYRVLHFRLIIDEHVHLGWIPNAGADPASLSCWNAPYVAQLQNKHHAKSRQPHTKRTGWV